MGNYDSLCSLWQLPYLIPLPHLSHRQNEDNNSYLSYSADLERLDSLGPRKMLYTHGINTTWTFIVTVEESIKIQPRFELYNIDSSFTQ